MNNTMVCSKGLEGYSPLDSLPSALRYNGKETESKDDTVLQAIIEDDVKKLETLSNQNSLANWSLTVKLALTINDIPQEVEEHTDADDADEVDADAKSKFSATFNALHVAIVLESTKVFNYLLKSMSEMSEEFVLKKVNVHSNTPEKVDVTERWIFQANCAHLAVKYMPTALQLLLTNNTSADLKDLKSEPFGTYPLHLAAMNNDALSTRILLRRQANLEVQDKIGYTPLHYASRRNNLSSLSELLEAGANPFTTSSTGKTPLGKANSYECAQLLLTAMSEDTRNNSGTNNPIRDALVQTAEQNQLPGATEAILDSAVTCPGGDGNLYVYDMSILSTQEQKDVLLNSKETASRQSVSMNEMDVHTKMKENGNSQLLLHPLMAMFLHIKWQLQKDTISVITEMILNLLHVILLSALGYNYLDLVSCTAIPLGENGVKDCFITSSGKYACLLNEKNNTWEILEKTLNCFRGPKELVGCMETDILWKEIEDCADDSCFKNLTTLRNRMGTVNESFEMRCHKNFIRTSEDKSAYPLLPICNALGHSTLWECWFSQGLTLCVMFTIMMTLFRECRELKARGCYVYFKSTENKIQIFICLTSMSFIGLAGYHTELATHFGAWALFFAWIDLTTYLGRFGIIGEYVYIVFNVTKILLRCLIVYVPTLIAFTFGFSMLLHSNPAFESWISASLKVLTMMLGELEFGDHFIYHEVQEIGGRNHSVQLMYLLFVLMVAVIIMNLVVAMTISATNELRHESEIIQVKKKVKDIVTAGNVDKTECCKTSKLLRKIYSKIPGTQQLPKMVKEFLIQKDTEKVIDNFQVDL